MLKCWSIVPISFVECASAWLKMPFFFGPNAPAKRGRLKFFRVIAPTWIVKLESRKRWRKDHLHPWKHCSIMFYPFGLHESSSLYVTSLSLYLSGFFQVFFGTKAAKASPLYQIKFRETSVLGSVRMRGCVGERFSKPLHSPVGCVKVARAEEGFARHATFFRPKFVLGSMWGTLFGRRVRLAIAFARTCWCKLNFDQVVVPADDMGLAWIRRTYPKMHKCPCHVPSEKG